MRTFTLSHKLYLTVIPLALMGASISVITWQSLKENATPLVEAQQLRGLALTSLSLLRAQDDATKTMMLDPDNPSSNMRKIKAYDENQKVLERIGKQYSLQQVQEILQRMRDLDAKVLRDIDTNVLEAVGEGRSEQARKLYFEKYEPERAKYEGFVRKLIEISDRESKSAQLQLEQSNRASLRNILTTLGFGMLIVAGWFVFVARSITHRMSLIASNLKNEYDAGRRFTEMIRAANHTLSNNLSSTSSALHEIEDSVSKFAVHIQSTSKHAGSAKACSTQAVASADGASGAIRELIISTEQAQQQSSQIMTVIKAIDDIAFKTNILALNAAVEAARAGKAGLGFSVVADEVRNLAIQSAEAARRSADLSEASVAKSKQAVAMSERAASALNEIIAKSREIHGVIEQIASNAQFQDENIAQITSSLNRIGGNGSKCAEEAEKTLRIAETLGERSASMEQVVQELRAVVGAGHKT